MNMLVKLFFAFIQVGLFSVGGGYAAIPLIQAQIVNIHRLMSMEEFTDLITIAEMTPGQCPLILPPLWEQDWADWAEQFYVLWDVSFHPFHLPDAGIFLLQISFLFWRTDGSGRYAAGCSGPDWLCRFFHSFTGFV